MPANDRKLAREGAVDQPRRELVDAGEEPLGHAEQPLGRRALEQALAIDATALEGSAFTTLGSLYYQVPGWPIGFGDVA